jgi:hypothetical protein
MEEHSLIEMHDIADHRMPEQNKDYSDAIAPLNDQLVQAKFWRSLEVWTIKVRIQRKDDDAWVKKVWMKLGEISYFARGRIESALDFGAEDVGHWV